MSFQDEFSAVFPVIGVVEQSQAEVISADHDLIEIKYHKMYEAPTLNLEGLLAIGALFGTKSVDVDNYANGGCETCDYGSEYGHTLQIRRPTKNVEAARLLIGKVSP